MHIPRNPDTVPAMAWNCSSSLLGIQIAREAVAAIRDRVAGVQVSAPFGNVKTAAAVVA